MPEPELLGLLEEEVVVPLPIGSATYDTPLSLAVYSARGSFRTCQSHETKKEPSPKETAAGTASSVGRLTKDTAISDIVVVHQSERRVVAMLGNALARLSAERARPGRGVGRLEFLRCGDRDRRPEQGHVDVEEVVDEVLRGDEFQVPARQPPSVQVKVRRKKRTILFSGLPVTRSTVHGKALSVTCCTTGASVKKVFELRNLSWAHAHRTASPRCW